MRHVLALFSALAVFAVVICAIAAATPWLLELFYKCAPHDGSCGDTAGWGMIILSPILVPTALLLAGAGAVVTYLRVVRINRSKNGHGNATKQS
jgi:hypothetical protein